MPSKEQRGRSEKPRRRGQVAAETARFELRDSERFDSVQKSPPHRAYGRTFVRGFVRDPRHLVAVWEVSQLDAAGPARQDRGARLVVKLFEEPGGQRLGESILPARSGTCVLSVPGGARTVWLALERARDGYHALPLARSALLRVPPAGPSLLAEPLDWVQVPEEIDRRRMLRAEPPPPAGQSVGQGALSAGERLRERLALAARRRLKLREREPSRSLPLPESPVESRIDSDLDSRAAPTSVPETRPDAELHIEPAVAAAEGEPAPPSEPDLGSSTDEKRSRPPEEAGQHGDLPSAPARRRTAAQTPGRNSVPAAARRAADIDRPPEPETDARPEGRAGPPSTPANSPQRVGPLPSSEELTRWPRPRADDR